MESDNKLIIYKASAGTGKTYTLVKEYLKLLIRRPASYKHILAITFTNAATLEMKTRILESLSRLSNQKDEFLASQIIDELGKENEFDLSDEDLRNNARKALSNIIHDYSRFEISTIDAFFNRLVRSMARELKLPLRYDIELEPDNGLNQAIRQLYELDEKGVGEVWKWLEEFAFSRIEDDKGWKIDREILKIGKKIFDEKFETIEYDESRDQKLLDLKNELDRTIHDFENPLKQWSRQALDLIKKHQIPFEHFKGKSTRSTAKKFEKLLQGDFSRNNMSALLKVYSGEDHWYSDALYQQKFDALTADGLDELNANICKHYVNGFRDYNTANVIERNIYAYALLNAIRKNLKDYRDENNVLFLSDNASVIHHLLRNDDAEFLYEKTGSYYKHIFVDEFQDTSNFQWKNLLPLIENALSDASESHRIFVVGDVKQSIYRFRGGDMQLLLEGVEKDLSIYREITEVKDLKNNYRSKQKIVEFNNSFFQFSSQKILELLLDDPDVYRVGKVYGDLNQVPKNEVEGLTTIQFFPDNNWKDQAKERMLYQIKETLDSGYSLSDILILTSTNNEANDLSKFLITNQYEVISQSSLLLNNIPVIQFILSILSFLFRNDDQIARASAVYWYVKLSGIKRDIDYFRIREEQKYFLELLPEQFSRRVNMLSRMPVYELIEEIIVIFELDKNSGIFLQTFKELSLDYTSTGLVGIRNFLEWWAEEDRELAVTSTVDLNAIRVMTVHKSKGLEAPVVFVPYAFWSMNNSKETIFWTDQLEDDLKEFQLIPVTFKEEARESAFAPAYNLEFVEQLLDSLNKTYVAFTRARDQLHIYSRSYSRHEENNIKNISRFLYAWCIRQTEWEADLQMVQWGSSQKNISEVSTDEDMTLEQHAVMGRSYLDKVTIRSNAQNYYLLRDTKVAQNVQLGIKRHELLSRLKDKNDLEKILSSMEREGKLSIAESLEIRKEILELFQNEQFASWFLPHWEVMSERPIFSQGEIFQPDRVVFNEEEAIIIDYKKQVEDEKHKEQVRNYEKLLEQLGHRNIRKYLVYVDQLSIMEVN